MLGVFPEEATDLPKDKASYQMRPIGAEDEIRRDPETGREYLVACASWWVRRKCATSLAGSEFERGILYDTEAERNRREEAARIAALAREEASRRAERERKEVERRRQARAQRREAEARKAAMLATEKDELLRMYAGADYPEWCVWHSGDEFDPKVDFLQSAMLKHCIVAAARNRRLQE
jgi:hypothetical protein